MVISERLKRPTIEDKLYCCVATAIIGAGVASAGASIYGANQAADAQTNAANASIANQQQMYANNQNILMPYIQAGYGAANSLTSQLDPNGNNALSQLLKLTGATNNGADMTSALENTPGYQFTLSQGNRAVNNALAARGLGGSAGAVAKGVANYTEGLAGTTWQNVVNSLQNVFSSQTGATQNLMNSGVSAGNALAGVGTNTSNAISSSLIGAGNAQAAASNATGSAVSNAASTIPSAALLQTLLGGNNSSGLYSGLGNLLMGGGTPTGL